MAVDILGSTELRHLLYICFAMTLAERAVFLFLATVIPSLMLCGSMIFLAGLQDDKSPVQSKLTDTRVH